MENKPGKSASARFIVNKSLLNEWKTKIESVHRQLLTSISFWKNKHYNENEYPNRQPVWGIFS